MKIENTNENLMPQSLPSRDKSSSLTESSLHTAQKAEIEMADLSGISNASYERCRNRFNTKWSANDYANKHNTSRKHKKELRCIKAALSDLPSGAFILDIPCGVGRLTYFLHDLGYRVIGADYSHYMIQMAQKKSSQTTTTIQFQEHDVLAIKHPDKTFDAVLCNRLFHHYPTSPLRRAALSELARVCKGPLVVSFFNSYCLSAQWHKFRKMFLVRSLDRIPIGYHTFKRDVEACGLIIENTYYCSLGISPQTYVRIIKR